MTTVEYIRYQIPEADREAFTAAYRAAAVPLAASPYCMDYELTESVDEPGAYILRIRWTSVRDHLEGFRQSPEFAAFFAAIKPYVGAIQEMRHYAATGITGRGRQTEPPSLYDYMGGAEALERLTRTFYGHVAKDEILAPVFAGMDDSHPQRVALFLGEVFGGPPAYTAERGGHPHMVSRHLGRNLTERQRRRWIALLQDTADEVGLPDDPEFRAAFTGYLEWGTRMAKMFSAPGAGRVVSTPMPKWGWGLTPPYVPSAPADPDISLVLDSYRAYAAGDIDRAVAPLHPQVEWIEPEEFPGGGRLVGPAAVADYLRASRAGWSQFSSEPTAHRRGEDIVVLHHVSGTLADGTPHEFTVADVFTVRDGQVVRMQAYADPNEAP